MIIPGFDRRRVRKGQRVRNLYGKALPCVWQDCWRDGRTDHAVIVAHDAPERRGDTLTYIFCSPAHAEMWLAALDPGRRNQVLSVQRQRRSALGLLLP